MQISTPGSVRRHEKRGAPLLASALRLAGGLMLAGLTSAAAAAPDMAPAVEPVTAPLAPEIGSTWTAFVDWIAASYVRAPALVLGLVALLAVPPLALIGVWVQRREASGEISELRTQVRRTTRPPVAEPRDGVRTGHIPLRPVSAWIEVVDGLEATPRQRYNLQRTLLRIGRETDNDVCIADTTVHRYHAAVHRTEDAEFVITDLSSAGGNGVVVNGRAVAEARLSNGDMIELGNARLMFSAAPA
jgi:hypothetical protein